MPEQDLSGSPVAELGKRFFITFLLAIVVYRLGAVVPVPGVSSGALTGFLEQDGTLGAVLAWANMFNGGAIEKASVFGLGVMPYISASIIFQLLAFSVPALKQLQKEGEVGRRKINQYTRYATVLICLVQAGLAAGALQAIDTDGTPVVREPGLGFFLLTILTVTTGSMVLLWLAEQVTKHGVGNGISVIIMVGILSSFPQGFADAFTTDNPLPTVLGLVAVFLTIIACMVVITLARRRINLEQQRRVQGNRVYGGAQTQVPLMLNQAGVIPVIFSSPVMIILTMGLAMLHPSVKGVLDHGTPLYRYLYAGMIIFFTYFYISITVDLNEWANNFKQSGFFIKGVKPGAKTVDYLRFRLIRITFVGALSLAAVAVIPQIIGNAIGLSQATAGNILGGVGLLIVVGVSLDVIQKVSSYLLAHQYQGIVNQQRTGKGGGVGRAPKGPGGRKRF
ncbi:MAG: preprotein translocase subunit SecY [Planctomycetota bacterium]